ncbi:EsaB/YukD family protein [Dietzia aerolata]|uniref:EsaB/YukD family protein n=1 Tax=Dietzia aerolata TaxID=595984 RepID=UPI003645941A
MTRQSEVRGVAAGVEPLDQRRVSIVCRSTRVDVSLPAHLELVSVIPEVVDLVRDHVRVVAGPGSDVDVDARMGGGTGGSWQLSRLAGGPLAVSESLAQQRVHDGEILVLDHRPIPTPAPLFDDVLQGLTDPDVARSPCGTAGTQYRRLPPRWVWRPWPRRSRWGSSGGPRVG